LLRLLLLSALLYNEPLSLDEIQTKVPQCHHIRAIGNGYSISDVADTDGGLLSLKQLDRILEIDTEQRTVRVEAGVAIRTLNKELAAHGLCLPNQAAIDAISLGGALATAVHGTGRTGSFSSFVREIELVTASGTCLRLTKEGDPDAFAAACTSLGSLGVIYAVTLQCEPLFYLQPANTETTIETLISDWPHLREVGDFVQFFWNIETGRVAVQRWQRSDAGGGGGTPSYNALAWYAIDEEDKDLFSEIAVPLASLSAVLLRVRELGKRYIAEGIHLADINIRFVEEDRNALLSLSSDGPVACITFSVVGEEALHIYRDFEEEMLSFRGRPHWGKTHFLTREKVFSLYGSKAEKFAEVRRELDPAGVFSNDFTRRLLD
jgi:L-gulono-1,4-lactone dehydrogenase